MGVVKINQTFKTKVTPSRMFKALILDSHNLCPKLMFSSIKSIELLEGTGEAGSIKQMNFTEGKLYIYIYKYISNSSSNLNLTKERVEREIQSFH